MRQQIVYVEAGRRAAQPKKQNTTINFDSLTFIQTSFQSCQTFNWYIIECTFVNMKKNLAVQDQIVKHMFQKSHGKNNFSLG